MKASKVIFDPSNHTYWLDGKELKGITGVLSRRIFKNKYKDVNSEVLFRAATRGTNIHNECEMYDSLGILPESVEGQNYIKLCDSYKLKVVASEFIVSDNENYASAIDKVVETEEGEIDLIDIKTTYSLDKEYVSWQLSIYKYFFELQTGLKVSFLHAIWLRGDVSELIEVEDKGSENVIRLLECDLNDTEFFSPTFSNETELIRVESELVELEKMIKYYEEQKKRLSEDFVKNMEANGIKKFENEYLTITYVPATFTDRFDTAKFKELQPMLYKEFLTVSPRKASVRIKLK